MPFFPTNGQCALCSFKAIFVVPILTPAPESHWTHLLEIQICEWCNLATRGRQWGTLEERRRAARKRARALIMGKAKAFEGEAQWAETAFLYINHLGKMHYPVGDFTDRCRSLDKEIKKLMDRDQKLGLESPAEIKIANDLISKHRRGRARQERINRTAEIMRNALSRAEEIPAGWAEKFK